MWTVQSLRCDNVQIAFKRIFATPYLLEIMNNNTALKPKKNKNFIKKIELADFPDAMLVIVHSLLIQTRNGNHYDDYT